MNKIRFFETLLSEDKSRFINKNENLTDEQKAEVNDFFKKHANLENKIDWQRKNLTYDDFFNLMSQYDKNPKNLFRDDKSKRLQFMTHDKLETKDWLFVSPLTYEAAVYMDSFQCGGAGAKWCIGYEQSDAYWEKYVTLMKSSFILAFNKNCPSEDLSWDLKYMIEIKSDDKILIWDQSDESIKFDHSFLREFFTEKKLVDYVKKIDLHKKQDQIENVEISNTVIYRKDGELVAQISEGARKVYKLPEEAKNANIVIFPSSCKVIEKFAFKEYLYLKKVIFNEGLERIEQGAFESCLDLKSTEDDQIIFPKSLKYIGPEAFADCTSLEFLNIPEGVMSIGDWAFNNCTKLEVYVPESTKNLTEGVFSGCFIVHLHNRILSIKQEALAMSYRSRKPLIIYDGSEEDFNKIVFLDDESERDDLKIKFLK